MGWEFRRHRQIPKTDFETRYASGTKSGWEQKNDLYFLVTDTERKRLIIPETFGIKSAHLSALEIKVRERRKKSGFEKWKKYHGSFSQKLDLNNLDTQSIIAALRNKLRQNDLFDLSSYSNDQLSVVPCYTRKIRHNSSKFSYSYERALFSLQFLDEQNRDTLYFESIAIEGAKGKKHVKPNDLILDMPLTDTDTSVLTFGYPELISNFYLGAKLQLQ